MTLLLLLNLQQAIKQQEKQESEQSKCFGEQKTGGEQRYSLQRCCLYGSMLRLSNPNNLNSEHE